MSPASKLGFCPPCGSEVVGAKNPHRTRNVAATNFAAANFALVPPVVRSFGATGPYVCPHCGAELVDAPQRTAPRERR